MRQSTKITLPTGETISKHQHLRRIQIPGFPATTEHLPAGILTEDIIKQWPNHLVRDLWSEPFLTNQSRMSIHVLGHHFLRVIWRPRSLSQSRHSNAEVCAQWGPLLLQITARWSPKQISSVRGGRLRPDWIGS